MNAKTIFQLIAQKLQQNDLNGAKDLFFAHREELYEENPMLTLKTNFELRFIAKEFAAAYEDNEYFQSKPYVSQQMEESLRAIPSLIRANELSSFTLAPLEEDEAIAMLKGQKRAKNEELLYLLSKVQKEKDIGPYVEPLVGFLTREDVHDDVKSFALMLLSERNIDSEVVLLKRGERFTLIPSHIGSPFANPTYTQLRQGIEMGKDVSVNEIAIKLLDQFALYMYPRKALLGTVEETQGALIEVAKAYLYGSSPSSEKGMALDNILKHLTALS